jgi:transmembrane sensor
MTDLRAPLKTELRALPSEASVARMWRGIEQRTTSTRRPCFLRVATLAAAALALGCAAMLGSYVLASLRSAQTGAVLTLRDGTPWPGTLMAHSTRQVALSDGSSLRLAKGAALESLRNSEAQVLLKQVKGKVSYAVEPGGPRTWTIECGEVSVEVVGTRFEVDRDEKRVRVAVSEGVVLVRGDRVPDRVARLTVGEAIEVALLGNDPPPAAELRPPGEREAVPESESAAPAPRQSAAPWRKLAARGEHGAAYRALGERGIASLTASASVEDLFALADVARLSGHAEDAVAPLTRIIHGHRGDVRAALAAFTLGRIQLRTLQKPAAAARTLSQALTLSLPTDLQEDTYALLVEAQVAAGERAEAQATLARCRSAGRECRGAAVFLVQEPAR